MTQCNQDIEIVTEGKEKKAGRIILGSSAQPAPGLPMNPVDIIYHEPFPEARTRLWLPGGVNCISRNNVQLVVTQDVLQGVTCHTGKRLDREMGGFLIGNRYRCTISGQEYVLVDQVWAARYTEGDEVSLRFTNDSWADFDDQLQTRFRGKLLVGWYHSHPNMAVFLSDDDLLIHKSRFYEPWMFALVIEPVTNQGGFFATRGNFIHPSNPIEFYEYFGHRRSDSFVTWINYCPADDHAKSADSAEDDLHCCRPRVSTQIVPISTVPARRTTLKSLIVRFLNISLIAFMLGALLVLTSRWKMAELAFEKLNAEIDSSREAPQIPKTAHAGNTEKTSLSAQENSQTVVPHGSMPHQMMSSSGPAQDRPADSTTATKSKNAKSRVKKSVKKKDGTGEGEMDRHKETDENSGDSSTGQKKASDPQEESHKTQRPTLPDESVKSEQGDGDKTEKKDEKSQPDSPVGKNKPEEKPEEHPV